MSRQAEYERLFRRTTEPVSTALHSRGFFGLFGVDVLVDTAGRQYVVDINPRVLGSTPLVFTQRGLESLGRFWEVGLFLTKVLVKAESADAVVGRAESVEGGELIVYSLVPLSLLQTVNPSGEGSATRVLLLHPCRSSASTSVRFKMMRSCVYSLIQDGNNKVFRCQIAVFANSVTESRAMAEAFCSEVNGDTA